MSSFGKIRFQNRGPKNGLLGVVLFVVADEPIRRISRKDLSRNIKCTLLSCNYERNLLFVTF